MAKTHYKITFNTQKDTNFSIMPPDFITAANFFIPAARNSKTCILRPSFTESILSTVSLTLAFAIFTVLHKIANKLTKQLLKYTHTYSILIQNHITKNNMLEPFNYINWNSKDEPPIGSLGEPVINWMNILCCSAL